MVKISDALRGAADRAPLDGVTVSTHSAARRVSVNRGMRGAASGVVGATAVVVLALGVIGPQGLASTGSSEDGAMDSNAAAAEAAPEKTDMDSASEGFSSGFQGLASGSQLAWGVCGQVDATAGTEDSAVTLTPTAPGEVEPGASIPVEVTATVADNVLADEARAASDELVTTGPSAIVLWDGIVVATLPAEALMNFGPADEQILNEDATLTSIPTAAGESQTFAIDVPLVNCWDGEPLPAAKYELLVSQDFSIVGVPTYDDADSLDTTTGDSTEPSQSDAPSDVAPLPSADPSAAEEMVIAGYGSYGGPVGFAITGEPVEDPFAQYLGEPVAPVEPVDPGVDPAEPPVEPTSPSLPPEGTLTPDVARQMYQAGLTDSRWDMAKGSQRWLMTNDSAAPYTDEGWAQSYFGCAMQGQTDGTFPDRSAEMTLLDVSGEFPSRIGVSYGWVVDGNPEFQLAARNVSDFTLTGISNNLSSQLYLVKDGRVVAEAWGVNPHQNVDQALERYAAAGGFVADDVFEDTGSMVMPDGIDNGFVEPGASVASTYLWRDVQGCWSGENQETVTPGVYTLVSSQYVPVGTSEMYLAQGLSEPNMGVDGSAVAPSDGDVSVGSDASSGGDASFGWSQKIEPFSGSAGGAGQDSAIAPELTIAPAPDQYDAVDLQVWTSFGTITVN